MSAEAWYLDTSALVKTIIEEPEPGALLRWLDGKDQLVACELVRVEAVRAVRVSDPRAVDRAPQALATLTLIRLDEALTRRLRVWSGLRCLRRYLRDLQPLDTP